MLYPVLALMMACGGVDGKAELNQEQANQVAMNDHYDDAVAARDAVVAGDLATAQKHVQADDLNTAAAKVGDMAQACGSCHTSKAAIIALPVADKPDWKAAKNEMLRHQWAVDTLWIAMITPDDALLSEVLSELGDSPLASHAQGMDPLPRAIELEVQVHKAAQAMSQPERRGQAYGTVIASCAECHALGKVKPAEVRKGQ